MIITELKPQKKNPSRFNLSINGEFVAGISATTLAKFTLYQGKKIDQPMLDDLLYQELKQRFLERLVGYITRSPKSIFQAKQYLKNVEYKKRDDWYGKDQNIDFEKMFEEIVNQLEEQRLLSDRDFAKAFVESRLRSKPRGKSVLISELMGKGINTEIAREICDELVQDECSILKQAFTKHFKNEKFDIDNQKHFNYLYRKGFSYDLIKEFAKNESSK